MAEIWTYHGCDVFTRDTPEGRWTKIRDRFGIINTYFEKR